MRKRVRILLHSKLCAALNAKGCAALYRKEMTTTASATRAKYAIGLIVVGWISG